MFYDEEELGRLAVSHGFRRVRPRNWIRRTGDFIQLINLQRSQWSREDNYLNFALWPLALGEPESFVEYKFHFRTRAEIIAPDLPGFFDLINRDFQTLDQLRPHSEARHGLTTGELLKLMQRSLH